MPGFEKVLVNGEDKRLNYGTLELFADGVYEVGVVVNGETYTFTVTVDSTLPEITLNGAANGGATNGNVTIATTEETATLTVYLNGEEINYEQGNELKAEGVYLITAIDALGNITEISFTIDKTAPTIILNGVENKGATRKAVSLGEISEEATVTVYFNDEEITYEQGDSLTKVGKYRVVVTDSSNNASEYTFTIEKKVSNGEIALIVIGGLGIVGGIVFFILKKRKII